MRLTYKYRLNPTTKQRHVLNDIFFQMQTVYNDALNERRWYWNRSRKSISYFDQWPKIRDECKSSPDEMGLLNAASIQQMLRRLDKGYKASYSGQRGLPRFKGRNRFSRLSTGTAMAARLRATGFTSSTWAIFVSACIAQFPPMPQ